ARRVEPMRRWEILCSTGVALGLLLSAPVCPEEWDPPDFSPPTPSPESRIPAFHGSRAFDDLKRLVECGPRPPGSKALAESRRWIIGQLKQAGCETQEDRFVAETPVGSIPMTNVIAKIPGTRPEVVMVAGHYDTKLFSSGTFLGANDGGSSAAF